MKQLKISIFIMHKIDFKTVPSLRLQSKGMPHLSQSFPEYPEIRRRKNVIGFDSI
jgi:hypothetical protein